MTTLMTELFVNQPEFYSPNVDQGLVLASATETVIGAAVAGDS